MPNDFVSHLVWSGALQPSRGTQSFSRDLSVTCSGITVPMSAAPDFHGDPLRANPEQLFVASLSACQALTYLFLAARGAIAVASYTDDAVGTLEMQDGRMRMTRVVLRPHIIVADAAVAPKARELVAKAHRACFIANSVSCVVDIQAQVEVKAKAA